MRMIRYCRVSLLRRSMKLRSCSSTRSPTRPDSAMTGYTPTCTGPPSMRSSGSGSAAICAARSQSRSFGKAARGVQQLLLGRAQPDGHQPLVLDGAVEQRLQLAAARVGQGVGDRVGQRVVDQRAAHVQVAREPAQRQPVHQRQRQVGRGREDQDQRHQEAQLQAKGFHGSSAAHPDLTLMAGQRLAAPLASWPRNSASLAFSRRAFSGPMRSRIFCPAVSDSSAGSAYS